MLQAEHPCATASPAKQVSNVTAATLGPGRMHVDLHANRCKADMSGNETIP